MKNGVGHRRDEVVAEVQTYHVGLAALIQPDRHCREQVIGDVQNAKSIETL